MVVNEPKPAAVLLAGIGVQEVVLVKSNPRLDPPSLMPTVWWQVFSGVSTARGWCHHKNRTWRVHVFSPCLVAGEIPPAQTQATKTKTGTRDYTANTRPSLNTFCFSQSSEIKQVLACSLFFAARLGRRLDSVKMGCVGDGWLVVWGMGGGLCGGWVAVVLVW
ncbi:hypothetical protein BaRGS_00020768 [Batillaria attramentaria]|uniref:Uncharacterized protein n=1 Tax=Batillaria attramentaria TaxID=370345 RepID=A0ABD0KLY6_9CAEN